MKTRYTLVLILLLAIIQFQAVAQKGTIATYKADKMYICFMHIKTGKMKKEPIVAGNDVTIQHNISYEKIALSYTSPADGLLHHMILSLVRYEQEKDKGIIMEDGDGNPATVYNKLRSDGSLSVIQHGINQEGYSTMLILEGAQKVY